jgi:hypothetical protein
VVGKKIRRAQKACEGSTPSARTTFSPDADLPATHIRGAASFARYWKTEDQIVLCPFMQSVLTVTPIGQRPLQGLPKSRLVMAIFQVY